ncbi:MAG: CoA pyrophosphatase [Sphingomonadales bacterium]
MIGKDQQHQLFERLSRREALAPGAAPPARFIAGDRALQPGGEKFAGQSGFRKASVLIPIIDRREEPTILLTKRTPHLADHAGQISFPGGSREASDRDAVATALRETEEEVGIEARFIDIIGRLGSYHTSTGFRIAPIVGVLSPELELNIDSHEVAEVFEVPLRFILDPSNYRMESRIWRGEERFFYAVPFEDHYIWGATAAMLVNLYHALLIHGGIPEPVQGEQ